MLLYQPDSGYCYNSDSLFLYDFINSFHPKGKVLDVGAGCGVVGLLVARDNEKIELEAVEKQEVFRHFSKTNARVNKIAYRLHECDFLDMQEIQKYDYIISNPPFYPAGVQKSQNEILFNARYNVHLPLEKFFKKVSRLLRPHSHFIFCYDATQFGNVCVELERVKMKIVDVQFVHPKIDRSASLVMIHARNGSKAMMKVWPPLISFEGDNPSQKVQNIYKKANTQSIKCQI
ncbi:MULTISPECIES: tRNA1(Val) (adenine(37)-N6)-methyltransferase [Sulfurimonas]|uniref:tRNA1(Val) (adenine(37)-N6)-methyltransferase n=1 Tax=Sulfurimonas TaxID=202746 RepID=UPI00125FDBEB|nr:methyltransferase [Sulfurimonas hydrogeniphila]